MWVERLARFGYATKGAVYGLIGILAVMAAFTSGGKTTGTKGALRTIAAQPFGQILLILVAVGLVGYVIWRFVEAIKDPDHKGSDFKGIVTRLGYIISGLIYAGVAVNAALLAIGSSSGGGGDSKQTGTARLLSQPFGQWLVGTLGALIIGLGFYYIYKAYKTKFRKKLNLRELDYKQEKLVVNVCRFGITARGVIFTMLGFFLIQAARQFEPSKARGLDGALHTIAQQPYGKFLLAIAAFGLIAYGIYMLVQARYRHFKTN
ncbi:DUF1206 domain-containing protein [Lyngbya sp. PCC 8106]|uniref:DUF1206 domain-containing protein n=1 Tax=Lyngbya sp. (strain PCC 8106) TaxID=313612 RepID=UPI0000EACE2B|nr:DUF1206 domain-containing protein [Lyngbya sp. PCC 8106]EAW34753.1 hypothetical protein L8106_26062 [Lyngbya sp. PCC 8106]